MLGGVAEGSREDREKRYGPTQNVAMRCRPETPKTKRCAVGSQVFAYKKHLHGSGFVFGGSTCSGSPASVCRASSHAAWAPLCQTLRPAGSRDEEDRKQASDTAELAFEVAEREQERGGAA